MTESDDQNRDAITDLLERESPLLPRRVVIRVPEDEPVRIVIADGEEDHGD